MNQVYTKLIKFDFQKYWKSFIISLIATFLMAALPHFGVTINFLHSLFN